MGLAVVTCVARRASRIKFRQLVVASAVQQSIWMIGCVMLLRHLLLLRGLLGQHVGLASVTYVAARAAHL